MVFLIGLLSFLSFAGDIPVFYTNEFQVSGAGEILMSHRWVGSGEGVYRHSLSGDALKIQKSDGRLKLVYQVRGGLPGTSFRQSEMWEFDDSQQVAALTYCESGFHDCISVNKALCERVYKIDHQMASESAEKLTQDLLTAGREKQALFKSQYKAVNPQINNSDGQANRMDKIEKATLSCNVAYWVRAPLSKPPARKQTPSSSAQ
jgi:hypothetical protein